ncbi:hypothetical protein AAHC03_024242 [Spirometra sp. Aus1]
MGIASVLLYAILLALLPYCFADIKELIIDDFSATPENASFPAVRLILGQPKKKDLRLTVPMRWDFEDSSNLPKAIVVLFEKFEVPPYGDACPNVILSLENDTNPSMPILEIQGSCMSHDLEKEWFAENVNQATLQIQGLSPASKSQADSLRLLLLAALLHTEDINCPLRTLHCPTLLGELAQPVCLHSSLNDSRLNEVCRLVLISSPNEPISVFLAWINVIQFSLYAGLALGLCGIFLAVLLWRRKKRKEKQDAKGRPNSLAKGPAVAASSSPAKTPHSSNGFAHVEAGLPAQQPNRTQIFLPSLGLPQISNRGPPTTHLKDSEETAENAPLLDKAPSSQPGLPQISNGGPPAAQLMDSQETAENAQMLEKTPSSQPVLPQLPYSRPPPPPSCPNESNETACSVVSPPTPPLRAEWC